MALHGVCTGWLCPCIVVHALDGCTWPCMVHALDGRNDDLQTSHIEGTIVKGSVFAGIFSRGQLFG